MEKQKLFQIILNLFFAFSLLFPSFSHAQWVDFDAGSNADEALNRILSSSNQERIFSAVEERYGFDDDVWRASKRKFPAPRVEIFFDNTNPKAGEKVTAHAVPEFFKNDPHNLYYTWYLIHTEDGSIETATNSIESGIREASRIMARGDYDPDLDGQNYSNPSADPDNDGWPAVDDNSYDEDDKAAPMGGADGVGGLNEKSTEQYTDSDTYCRSLGNPSASECSYFTDAGDEKVYTPSTYYYTLQSTQSNYYCEECRNSLTMPADDCEVNRNKCCYLVANPADLNYENFDIDTAYCPTSYDSSYDSCYTSYADCNQSDVSDCISSKFSQCQTSWDDAHTSFNEEIYAGVSRCYKHKFGTNYDASGFRAEDDSGIDYPVSCKHKWEDAPGYSSGSGKFPSGEEEYWSTDPLDPDTDGDGFSDEADIIGLGQQSFTWTYQAGDRLGLVVEGTSMLPTDEKNAYYKIMWGYPDVCDATKTKLMNDDKCDDSDDYGYGFLATRSPSEELEENLKVSLTFSPDNPQADPSSANSENIDSDGSILNADRITVISSMDNTNLNPGEIYYQWQVSRGDPRSDSWREISIPDNFDTSGSTSGIGITQLNLIPKTSALSGSDDIIYFKVTLTASRSSEIDAGRGRSSVIIGVNKNGIRLSLHKVEIVNGKAAIGEEVCSDGLYAHLCPAVQYQMLAAKVTSGKYTNGNSEFAWTVNGNPHYPPPESSSLFSGWDSNIAFFPITKQTQEIEEVSVTATKKGELQPVAGSRLVTVVEPAAFIKSADTSTAWPASYVTEDPERRQSYIQVESSDMFDALTSSTASFYLDFVPYYILGDDLNTEIEWNMNGVSVYDYDFYEKNSLSGAVNLENNNQVFEFQTADAEGVYYNLSADVEKYWSDEERAISYTAWGVAPQNARGSGSATVATTFLSPFEETALNEPGQILAAIGTHLPHYFMYLLRLVLTIGVMYFASAALYGLANRLPAEYEKY